MVNKGRIFFSLFFCCFPLIVWGTEKTPVWKIRAAYHREDFSFASAAHGANFLLAYDRPHQWGLRGGFQTIDKFGDAASGFSVGGGAWLTQTTTASLDLDFAPNQVVLPREGILFEISQILFKKWVPALAYRFVHYRDADAHTLAPSLTWYFLPRFYGLAKYLATFNRLNSGQNPVNHSAMTKIDWNIVDPLHLFAGYARANESFESGNPAFPAGGFSAHHIFGGFSWEIYKGAGADFTYAYETRSNNATVRTAEVGFFYRW